MELSNLFELIKADRYTADGRAFITKILATDRKLYKPGEISPNTGLEKKQDGSWGTPSKTESEFTVLSAKEFKNLNTTKKRKYLLKLYDETSKATKTKPTEFWINKIKSEKSESLNLIYGLLPKHLLSNQNSKEEKIKKPSPVKRKTPLTGKTIITVKAENKSVHKENNFEKTKNKKQEEPKGIQSEINRAIRNGDEKLYQSITAMPKDYALTEAPKGDKDTLTINGKSYNSYYYIRNIDKYLRPRSINYYKTLDKNIIGTLSFYTFNGDKYMNKVLRGEENMTPLVEQSIKNMDTAFRNCPELGTDMLLYRYTNPEEIGNMLKINLNEVKINCPLWNDDSLNDVEKILKKQIGKKFQNAAFCSTNANKKNTIKKTYPIVYRIKTPKKTKALYLSPISNNRFSNADVKKLNSNVENEVLLNRNSKFIIDNVTREDLPDIWLGNQTKRIIVDLTLLDEA